MKMIERTAEVKAEVKALREQIKALNSEAKKCDDEAKKCFYEYFDLEGKYAIAKVDAPIYGMHDRGFTYEYACKEDERKEWEEQTAVHNKEKEWEAKAKKIRLANTEEIEKLENRICVLNYGVTKAEKRRIERLEEVNRKIAEHEALLKEYYKEKEELTK